MLLKENFKRLIDLGLGQADFSLLRRIFTYTEQLATRKAKLHFLQRCLDHRIFPKTINNIKLPSRLDSRSTTEIKRLILSKSKRNLRTEISSHYTSLRYLDAKVSNHPDRSLIPIIQRERYIVYNITSKYHRQRLDLTFQRIFERSNPSANNQRKRNTVNPELVTDLTKSLAKNEKDLLSIGPKFSLSPKVNHDTFAQLNVSFYRLANQIRWQHIRHNSNQLNPQQHEEYIAYPKSRYISKPETNNELEVKLRNYTLNSN